MPVEVKYEWGVPAGMQPHRPVVLGHDAEGGEVTLDLDVLHSGRLLIQAPSGAGKSTLLRRLISESARSVQCLLIDPEGEHTVLPRWSVDTRQPWTAAYMYETVYQQAISLRRMRSSNVLDLSELNREQQLIYLTRFVAGLINVEDHIWSKRCLVAIDECEVFTPADTTAFNDPTVGRRSRSALIDLMSRGRKRGLITILATHRLPQLVASVRAEARNFLIGGSSFDVDIDRAAILLGWSKKRAEDILPKLTPGMFVAVGAAFSKQQSIVKVIST